MTHYLLGRCMSGTVIDSGTQVGTRPLHPWSWRSCLGGSQAMNNHMTVHLWCHQATWKEYAQSGVCLICCKISDLPGRGSLRFWCFPLVQVPGRCLNTVCSSLPGCPAIVWTLQVTWKYFFFFSQQVSFFLSFFFFLYCMLRSLSWTSAVAFFLGFPPSVQPPASSKRHPLKTSNNENVSSLETLKWLLFS